MKPLKIRHATGIIMGISISSVKVCIDFQQVKADVAAKRVLVIDNLEVGLVNVNFRKIARGPGWERWLIVEDQHGDTAFAGEAILTYADASGYSDVECDVLFTRELEEADIEDLLKSIINILSGQGNVTIFTTRQLACRGFSLIEDEEGEYEDEDNDDA